MTNLRHIATLWTFVLAASACGDGGTASAKGAPSTTSTDAAIDQESDRPRVSEPARSAVVAEPATAASLPCAIDVVLRAKCQQCHGRPTSQTAPMSLVTLEDLQAMALEHPETPAAVYQRVGERIHDVTRPMPPRDQPALTQQELSVLDIWIEAGAPSGKACPEADSGDAERASDADASDAADASPRSRSTRTGAGMRGADTSQVPTAAGDAGQPDAESGAASVAAHGDAGDVMGVPPDESECDYVELRARQDESGTPYEVAADATDLYTCFLFDLGFDAPTHGLAFEAINDNLDVVHHWILRSLEPSDVRSATGPFLDCDQYYAGSKMIAGWAPGENDFYMPKEVGMELGSGLFYLEMHYNNIGRPAAHDQSGVRICTTQQLRPQSASISWLGSQLFSVPPKTDDYEVAGRCLPARQTEPIHIVRTWPHMHKLGTRGSMSVERADGSLETVFDEPFSFSSQIAYDIPVTLNPGDSLLTSCYFSNPSNYFVGVGTRTTDEMCHFFVIAYPARALTNDAPSTETQVCLDTP